MYRSWTACVFPGFSVNRSSVLRVAQGPCYDFKETYPNKRILATFHSNNEQELLCTNTSSYAILISCFAFVSIYLATRVAISALWEALAHICLRLLLQGTFHNYRETFWWSCWAGEFNLMCIRAAWITYLVSFERCEALTQRARKACRVSGLVHDYKWILKRLNSWLKLKIGLGFADVGFFHCKLKSQNLKW